jgi:starch synthase
LLKELGQDEKLIIPLAKSEVNKTNILTVHSIIDRQGQIDHSLLVKKSKEIKPTYLNNFKVCISSGSETALDKETNTLTLDFYKVPA